jgi:hypothetical protein
VNVIALAAARYDVKIAAFWPSVQPNHVTYEKPGFLEKPGF